MAKKKIESPAVRRTEKRKGDSGQAKKRTPLTRLRACVSGLRSRRSHQSFRLTRRRDYVRPLGLPGYWAFTLSVLKMMRANGKNLLLLGAVYVAVSLLFFGVTTEGFVTLREAVSDLGQELFQGNWGGASQASLLALSAVMGNVSPTLTEVQQVYAVLLTLSIWLSVVWLLRQSFAGHKVRIRDALYNAGAPAISTGLLFLVFVVQMLPIALAMIGYAAASASGLLDSGVEAMLFWGAAIALGVMSLYWATSTALALVVVTLPGMYPLRALVIAGDMVSGRRLRILYRILWMGLLLIGCWLAILAPLIMLDTWLASVWPVMQSVPLIPFVVLLLSAAALIATTCYIYMLYRKVVDDGTRPA